MCAAGISSGRTPSTGPRSQASGCINSSIHKRRKGTMNPGDVAPMVMGVTFFVVTGAVMLFRPITKRFGYYLEVLANERKQPLPPPQVDETRLANVLESLDSRLRRLEERQSFTDALLSGRKTAELPSKTE